jgi:hypothetical protein
MAQGKSDDERDAGRESTREVGTARDLPDEPDPTRSGGSVSTRKVTQAY